MANAPGPIRTFIARRWDSILSIVQWVLPSGLGAIVSGWAAALTQPLRAFAPFSYVAAGIIGGLVGAAIFALWGYFRLKIAQARYFAEISKPSDIINPLDSVFQRRRISVSGLKDPMGRPVSDKTFVECEFVGPAVLVPQNCTFEGLVADNCDYAALRADVPSVQIFNGVMMTGCVFRRCRFINCVLIFSQPDADFIDQMVQASGGRVNWLSHRLPSGAPSPAISQAPNPTGAGTGSQSPQGTGLGTPP
jgi:uncharacterized membrane protein YeaQ/YmgE (transglycosylase-associated protein family)